MVLIAINKYQMELCLGEFSLPNTLKASTNELPFFLLLETCKLNFLFEESTVILSILGSSSLE